MSSSGSSGGSAIAPHSSTAGLTQQGVPQLREFEDLDETDRAWSRIMLDKSPVFMILVMFVGGIAAGVLLASKTVPIVGISIFVLIPVLWVAHMVRERRKFIAACASRGISKKAARQLIAIAPGPKNWHEQ